MQELTSKEIQMICLEMLDYFNSYAAAHTIRYYMAGGTLLGAVRHQGFIPWDDDVDLMLPRPDYERLIREFDGAGKYELISCETNSQYGTPFARIWDKRTVLRWDIVKDAEIGVFIDLFPIDGFPKIGWKSNLHIKRLKYERTKVNSAMRVGFRQTEKHLLLKRALKHLWRKSANFYAREQNQIAQEYSFEECNYVGVTTTTAHIFRERNSKDIFSQTVWLPFEYLRLPAPSGYDIYLSHLYGDYMELPPKEQQKSEHLFTVYMR